MLGREDVTVEDVMRARRFIRKGDDDPVEETELGDSGLKSQELPGLLDKLAPSESETEKSIQELTAYSEYIKRIMGIYFDELAPLNTISSNKWCELFDEVFTKFPNSKAILTTVDYANADFQGQKMTWDIFKFKGKGSIDQALKILDNTITDYLKEKKFLNILDSENYLTTRKIWTKACALSSSTSTEIFEEYFNDTFKFWTDMKYDSMPEAFNSYRSGQRRKYDTLFLNFMEALGVPIYFAWLYWRGSGMEKVLVKALSEQYFKYKENPKLVEIYGLNSFLDKWTYTKAWVKGVDEQNQDAISKVQNRKRIQGGGLVRLPNYNKRFKKSGDENSFNQDHKYHRPNGYHGFDRSRTNQSTYSQPEKSLEQTPFNPLTVVPRSGAEYAYFTESFNNLHPFWGPLPAFICSWVYVVVLRPAEVAVITLTFAEYICQPVIDHYHIDKNSIENVKMYIALGALGLITFINIASVKLYVKIQNIFGAFKVLVCVVIIGAGIYAISTGYTDNLKTGFKGTHTKPSSIALAFYSGLWAYDGWSTVTTVTEEIKNPSRNIPLSILISVPLVTLLYVFMNVAYMAVLTIGEMEAAPAVAVVFGERILGTFSVIIPIGVALATFGCALSIQFSITRLCYVAGQEGHMIKAFSYVNVKRLTPAPAVAFQGLISLIFIMCGSIVTLIEFASFFIWIFYGVAMVSLIVLRYTKPGVHRPYKVPIWIPYFIFLVALFLSVTPIATDPSPKYLFALAFIISGIFVYIPFVYYKMKLPLMDHFTKLIQVVFQAVPPEKYENQNNVDNVDNEKTKADKK